MAWTSVGFDGTITEIQWAGMAGLLGNGYVAAGNGDCLVTAVGGARQVSVAAGSLYGDGVLSTNSGAETVALTTPTNGQWYVIALRRTWATNTAALVAIAGATTSTSTPTAPPTSFPVLNTNPGVLTDQPIAWAWCNSANTNVVVYDIRLKAVKSLPPVVATSAERDAKFMSPTQGLQVWRDDLGAVETYYGLYNASTNPGGRDTAGWYVDDRQTGLIPMKPSSVVIASGSGSVNDIGTVTFSGATAISLNNVFTSAYRNYKIVVNTPIVSTAGNLAIRLRNGGTDNTTNNYYQYWLINRVTGATQTNSGGPNNYQSLYPYTNVTNGLFNYSGDIFAPNVSTVVTTINGVAMGSDSTSTANVLSGIMFNATGSFDGITLLTTAGTVGGTVTVYGYND